VGELWLIITNQNKLGSSDLTGGAGAPIFLISRWHGSPATRRPHQESLHDEKWLVDFLDGRGSTLATRQLPHDPEVISNNSSQSF
jgi:hypothetical protein